MRRISFLATALATVLFVAGLSAQAKPDFTGKWVSADPAPAAPAGAPAAGAPPAGGGAPGGGGGGRGGGRGGGGGGNLCAQECTIAQDATTLTVTRTTQAGEQKAVYKLDGSESKNTQQGRGGATEVVSKAVWEGNKIAISTTQAGRDGGAPTTVKVLLGMNAGQLEVEVEGNPAKRTYKKG